MTFNKRKRMVNSISLTYSKGEVDFVSEIIFNTLPSLTFTLQLKEALSVVMAIVFVCGW